MQRRRRGSGRVEFNAHRACRFRVQRGVGELDETGHDAEEFDEGDNVLVAPERISLSTKQGRRVADELKKPKRISQIKR